MPETQGTPSGLARGRVAEPLLDLLDDPRARGQFLPLLAERHRPLRGPRGRSQRCSCGEPYLSCPVAAQIRPLLAAARPEPQAGASHWFG
jgi:hypothetical protein